MYHLEGFVLHNDFIGLSWNLNILWISQVNDVWNICFGSGESDRMPLKYEVTLYPKLQLCDIKLNLV